MGGHQTSDLLRTGTFLGKDGRLYRPATLKLREDLDKRVRLLKADPHRADLDTQQEIINRALDLGLRALELGITEIRVGLQEEAANG